MSWATDELNRYVYMVSVTGDFMPDEVFVRSFIIHNGDDKLLKTLLNTFLKEIDDRSLVEINIDEKRYCSSGERIYGGRPTPPPFFIDIGVFDEDVDKVGTKEPIRICFNTNVYPHDKASFIKFFTCFAKILR